MDKAFSFLSSDDLSQSKFGAFLFRRFLFERCQELQLIQLNQKDSNESCFYVDELINKNIFKKFEEALNNKNDYQIYVRFNI